MIQALGIFKYIITVINSFKHKLDDKDAGHIAIATHKLYEYFNSKDLFVWCDEKEYSMSLFYTKKKIIWIQIFDSNDQLYREYKCNLENLFDAIEEVVRNEDNNQRYRHK